VINQKCSAAEWCVARATPNTTVCALHLKYPLAHSFEAQAKWLSRVRANMKAAEARLRKQQLRAATKAASPSTPMHVGDLFPRRRVR
jgi:hypothetical protein